MNCVEVSRLLGAAAVGALSHTQSNMLVHALFTHLGYACMSLCIVRKCMYSCCSHLEHTASVKRFVSLQFVNVRQSVGLLGRGMSPSQGRHPHTNTE
jgi:hypothetical protein